MQISVPHNWQGDLLDALDLSCVGDFYGKLESDMIGGGRASNISMPVCRKTIADEVRRIHARGLRFTYLLNATCLDNRELTPRMQHELARLVDWLAEIGVDGVTVSLPFMFDYVRKRAPHLSLTVSTMSHVSTPDKARFWEGLGAQRITLDEVMVNRDFRRIEAIRAAVRCKLQVIVNNGCLGACPFTTAHSAAQSHASQAGHVTKGFLLDFYRIYCMYMRLRDPSQFLRADWIRPEDLAVYENMGIDGFKLVNRGMSTPSLRRIVAAYTARRFDGNLLDLLPSSGKNRSLSGSKGFLRGLHYFFRPGSVNVFKLARMRGLMSRLEDAVVIDNRSLDGFLDRLRGVDCNGGFCRECGMCREAGTKAIRTDPVRLKRIVGEMEGLLDTFISGSIFRYL